MMRALILVQPNVIELRELPQPTPNAGELVVKVMAATTCGTDLKAFKRGHPQIPMPGVFGHEYSGVVVECGPNAKFRVGDEVMGVHSAPCQSCFWCLHDQENLCETIMASKVLGSYAEFLRVPERIANLNVFKKPPHLSFEVAALLEPLSCVAQGIQLLPKGNPGQSTLVIGPGAIGLMFVAALKSQGVQNVVLAGRNNQRLREGEKLGAKTVVLQELEPHTPRRFDTVIECTGQIPVWERSIDFVRKGGSSCSLGVPLVEPKSLMTPIACTTIRSVSSRPFISERRRCGRLIHGYQMKPLTFRA